MVDTTTPTFADQRWGPEPYALFDYYRNPVRDNVDTLHPNGQNPLWIIRHGGGGQLGEYVDVRTSRYGDSFYLPMWLCANQPGSNDNAPATHWDVCSIESGQQTHFEFFSGLQSLFPRSRQIFMPHAIRDLQRAIASLKHMCRFYGFDPNRCIGYGESYGASLMALAAIVPPFGGPGRRTVWQAGDRRPATHDSTLRGVFMSQAQIDVRNSAPGNVDYIAYQNFGGWLGTDMTDSAEFDAVSQRIKASLSIRAYFEAGELDSYPGFFVGNVVQGTHDVHPFQNPHCSQQHADMIAAMVGAGLTETTSAGGDRRIVYGQQLRTGGAYQNTLWPDGPDAASLAKMQPVEAWAAAQIA